MALTLLDLSAFDTINHSLLYDCLHNWLGLDGTVLLGIKSHLYNHTQKIKIGDSFSEAVILPFSVPQGSVLGHLIFTLYTSHLSQVIYKFNVTHNLYADDTQISRNFDSGMEELTKCLKSVQEWMDGVTLKLEKTKFIIIGHKVIRESLALKFPVPHLQNNISLSVEVRNWVLSLTQTTPLTIILPRFAGHVTIIFMIYNKFANSLVLTLQCLWQMLW